LAVALLYLDEMRGNYPHRTRKEKESYDEYQCRLIGGSGTMLRTEGLSSQKSVGLMEASKPKNGKKGAVLLTAVISGAFV